MVISSWSFVKVETHRVFQGRINLVQLKVLKNLLRFVEVEASLSTYPFFPFVNLAGPVCFPEDTTYKIIPYYIL